MHNNRLIAGIHALIARTTDQYTIDQLKALSDEMSNYDAEYLSAFEGMTNKQIATAVCSLWHINTEMADCSRCSKRDTCKNSDKLISHMDDLIQKLDLYYRW